jgi:glucose uptake protein GlcU
MLILNVGGFIIGVIRNHNKEMKEQMDRKCQMILAMLVCLMGIFGYAIFDLLETYHIIMYIMICINNVIGMVLYNKKQLNLIDNVFGHHELFHITTIIDEIMSWSYKIAICNKLNILV